MKQKNYLLILCIALMPYLTVNAFNINVENVSLENQVIVDQTVMIEFDLSWNGSWRRTTIPYNWDAAWVFVKFSVGGTEWQHVLINQAGYTVPSGCAIDVSADSLGAFFYRSVIGGGSNNWDNIRLKWDYGAAGINDDAFIEVRIFAIEMVYVPEEDFYLGDGGAIYRFHVGNDNSAAYEVTSEAAISLGGGATDLWSAVIDATYGNGFEGATPLEADYPKGHDAFYCMKYEMSQEQYVEFLNTLTYFQQDRRTKSDLSVISTSNHYVMVSGANPLFRNGIYIDASQVTAPFIVSCYLSAAAIENGDGENLPCNQITWSDFAAYLDWSGLRPMTELEFEKACRGTNTPVIHEYAWGNYNWPYVSYILNATNRGTQLEEVSNPIVNAGNANMKQGTGGVIFRCGIFAASGNPNTRQESGGTYYGIMEMSGNTTEMVVGAYSTAGQSYTGLHGDGIITYYGDGNVHHWPGINGNDDLTVANGTWTGGQYGISDAAGACLRGGNFFSTTGGDWMISDRDDFRVQPNSRARWTSGRGIRIAN